MWLNCYGMRGWGDWRDGVKVWKATGVKSLEVQLYPAKELHQLQTQWGMNTYSPALHFTSYNKMRWAICQGFRMDEHVESFSSGSPQFSSQRCWSGSCSSKGLFFLCAGTWRTRARLSGEFGFNLDNLGDVFFFCRLTKVFLALARTSYLYKLLLMKRSQRSLQDDDTAWF